MSNMIEHSVAVVISDVHVADPTNKNLDDFTKDQEFDYLVSEVIPRQAGGPATLVINGDFIDFPQVLPEFGNHKLGWRFGATREESEEKIRRVIAGHPRVFESLSNYLQKGGQVLILPGNHDIDLHWPSVFEILRKALGGIPSPQLSFVKEGEIDEQRVHIEHGNQYSFDNKFRNWKDPIIKGRDGNQRLERPWGTFFMDVIYNGIEEKYSFINQVHPTWRLAWIALKSFRDDERVSASVISDLLLFFVLHGKRYSFEHLLGREPEATSSQGVEEVLRSFGSGGSAQRLEAIVQETVKNLLSAAERIDSNSPLSRSLLGGNHNPEVGTDEEDVTWLLGRSDKRGMEKRQRDLLDSGEIDLVVFGHTHIPIDGNQKPSRDNADPRRVFNTGSWMPALHLEDDQPRWRDLKSYPRVSGIRYLVIDLSPSPQGRLVQLEETSAT